MDNDGYRRWIRALDRDLERCVRFNMDELAVLSCGLLAALGNAKGSCPPHHITIDCYSLSHSKQPILSRCSTACQKLVPIFVAFEVDTSKFKAPG